MRHARDDDDGFVVLVVACGVRDGGVELERSNGSILGEST